MKGVLGSIVGWEKDLILDVIEIVAFVFLSES